MAYFKYSGRDKDGEPRKGVIQANNKQLAIEKLRSQGINAREIEESKSILHRDVGMNGKIKNQEFVIYCRQFATLIRAGVSIVESTSILSEQTKSKRFSKILTAIGDDLKIGVSLSAASAKYPKAFPALYVNMIKTAEATGNLDTVLERLADTFEKQFKLKKKIQSAMVYPIVLMVLIFVVTVFMLVYLVPSFVKSFEEMGAELPALTVATVAVGDWIKTTAWKLIPVVILALLGLIQLYKRTPTFQYSVITIVMRIPVFGSILQKTAIARMSSSLSTLLSSSVNILRAIQIVEGVVGNIVVVGVLRQVRQNLETGKPITSVFEQSWVFPKLVSSMVRIGESTGTLDQMLHRVADFYQEEVDRAIDSLKALIEPIMLLILAAIVGVIVASIFLPMFSLYEQI